MRNPFPQQFLATSKGWSFNCFFFASGVAQLLVLVPIAVIAMSQTGIRMLFATVWWLTDTCTINFSHWMSRISVVVISYFCLQPLLCTLFINSLCFFLNLAPQPRSFNARECSRPLLAVFAVVCVYSSFREKTHAQLTWQIGAKK